MKQREKRDLRSALKKKSGNTENPEDFSSESDQFHEPDSSSKSHILVD